MNIITDHVPFVAGDRVLMSNVENPAFLVENVLNVSAHQSNPALPVAAAESKNP
jgi:hypothetical protein